MFSSIKIVVKYKTETSDAIQSFQGVKQGDASSSLLFMMYVNGITENIDDNIDGFFKLNELKLFLSFFSFLFYSHFIFIYRSFVIIIYRQFTKYIINTQRKEKLISLYARARTHTHTYTHTYTHPHIHAYTHTNTHVHTRTHTHQHTRTHTYAHAHTHTHAHTYTIPTF